MRSLIPQPSTINPIVSPRDGYHAPGRCLVSIDLREISSVRFPIIVLARFKPAECSLALSRGKCGLTLRTGRSPDWEDSLQKLEWAELRRRNANLCTGPTQWRAHSRSFQASLIKERIPDRSLVAPFNGHWRLSFATVARGSLRRSLEALFSNHHSRHFCNGHSRLFQQSFTLVFQLSFGLF